MRGAHAARGGEQSNGIKHLLTQRTKDLCNCTIAAAAG
jgi:hypothetical protein